MSHGHGPNYTPVHLEDIAVTTPPPYMDPGNVEAKKKMSRIHKESISEGKRCDHCGAVQGSPPAPHEKVLVWPAVRPVNHIHQDSRQFIGYVLIIAVVIFLLFAACKYLP
ncbi:unnamed protein product [Caenorhabditis auriculariae]|uniref:Uncharacterized protein n=1 Tax=Caenorhabditis auriculariae TaxID=2777116 RepID=A0A8S1GQ53_9PELO|nr:unnamed protein product [Caenorhabditis auriculariae]